MFRTLDVAKTLYVMYNNKFGQMIDEMKMHKLMYFIQRESLMYNKVSLFDECFYGWKYGPVLKSVRSEYKSDKIFEDYNIIDDEGVKKIISTVLDRYGVLSSWNLSRLSHNELSWKLARQGLQPNDNGDVKINENAIMLDAIHELSNRKAEA